MHIYGVYFACFKFSDTHHVSWRKLKQQNVIRLYTVVHVFTCGRVSVIYNEYFNTRKVLMLKYTRFTVCDMSG